MRYLSSEQASAMARQSWKNSQWERDRRRQVVAQLTDAGMSANQIAVRFGVSDRTVVRDRRLHRHDGEVAS